MFRNLYRAIADPTFAKGGELPQESYVSHKRVGHFRHLSVLKVPRTVTLIAIVKWLEYKINSIGFIRVERSRKL